MSAAPAGSKPLKISFVVHRIADRSGGAERVLIETANRLAARGHDVEIVTYEVRRVPPFYPLAFGVRLVNLRRPDRARSRLRRLADLAVREAVAASPAVFPFDRLKWAHTHHGFARHLRHHYRWDRPDVIVPFMPPALTAAVLAVGRTIPIAASMHNAPEQDFENLERWDPTRYGQRRRRGLLDALASIMVLLPEYRDWYPERLRPRVVVVPNAVDPVDPAALAAAERGRVVMAVGRIAKTKRHGLLVDAWARLEERHPDWRLEIYGVGPDRPAVEEQIRRLGLKRVHLMGHVKDIKRRYLASAFLAHPAEFEGFPLAVTESLASGLPVVGFSDCSGLNRLVADGENGLLVEPGADRTAAFTDALDRMMRDPDLRARLSAGGPPSMAPYAPDAVIDLWERELGAAIAGGRG